jgi:SAM-dependent methyltransferase
VSNSTEPERARGGEQLPVDWDAPYARAPPWDIGRPQVPFIELADAGLLQGQVVELGCGTGEHTLLAAEIGCAATGVDISPLAIAKPQAKAEIRGLDARFLVHDALALHTLAERFAVVLDCGFFHILSDVDRTRLADMLRRIINPGGRYYLLCFSEDVPGDAGPR